jgi:DNA-binding transcriptional regulator GbsR (MarR family)
MTLTAIQQKFIVHRGEMGARWGIDRTVAQIHALQIGDKVARLIGA